jgi:hemoglobin-like flavoprotein
MRLSHIQIVQDTFGQIEPIADDVAASFYTNLFTIDPTLRGMFHGDMREQGSKLMMTLKLAVEGLREPQRILPALHSLAQRHVSYGVVPEHYAVVGHALMQTLEQKFAEDFTTEIREAWAAAYDLIASNMMQAADELSMTKGRSANA